MPKQEMNVAGGFGGEKSKSIVIPTANDARTYQVIVLYRGAEQRD